MTLVRIAYEQFSYQERLDDLIPRYLTILTETRPQNPSLDIESTFRNRTGLSIEEFMKIGVAFYSAAPAGELVSLLTEQYSKSVVWVIGPQVLVAWPYYYPTLKIDTITTDK